MDPNFYGRESQLATIEPASGHCQQFQITRFMGFKGDGNGVVGDILVPMNPQIVLSFGVKDLRWGFPLV